jgi:excisionase family DNA binding protein
MSLKLSRETWRTMATFGLREAALQVGVDKSTIHRAIQSGRLSAARTETGGYSIDAAELFRVYPPKLVDSAQQGGDEPVRQDATSDETADATELRICKARLEAQNEALRAIAEVEKQQAERERRTLQQMIAQLEEQVSKWQQQAERLALAPPRPAEPPKAEPARRSWWPWRRLA